MNTVRQQYQYPAHNSKLNHLDNTATFYKSSSQISSKGNSWKKVQNVVGKIVKVQKE